MGLSIIQDARTKQTWQGQTKQGRAKWCHGTSIPPDGQAAKQLGSKQQSLPLLAATVQLPPIKHCLHVALALYKLVIPAG